MIAELGFVALLLAFAACIYGAGAALIGARQGRQALIISARRAALATFPLLLVSCGALVIALVTERYDVAYVLQTTDPATPLFYRITALWGSQSGSLLFWSMILSGYIFGAVLLNWRSDRRLMPYFIVYTLVALGFFLGLKLFLENPFERYWIVTEPNREVVLTRAMFSPANGSPIPDSVIASDLADDARGLNPLLRHFGMIIHPPMLYLGFTGFLIPFAFAMSALASGDLSTNWIRATRRWTLVAWLFLSLGLILGGRWAYDVLGWGGYWGWDPVENAAFLPWLVGTAFIHSVMIQEKRGMFKIWNMFLVIGAFSAMIFGTFATRSGLVDSVHSFARSAIGFPMFTFWSLVTLVSVGLIGWRWSRGELQDERRLTLTPTPADQGQRLDALKASVGTVSLFSREGMFVLNNVVFVMLVIVIFWGSFGAPILTETLGGTQITLGVDYFYAVTPPLFLAMYILMGVAPLAAWGSMSLARLGRTMAIPLIFTAVSLVLIALTGATNIWALIGYGVVLLAGYVALYEIHRGARARLRNTPVNAGAYLRAVWELFGRNRQRYGGYLVHLGVVIIGVGVIGSTIFQQQTQQTLGVGEMLRLGDYQMRYDNFIEALAEDGRPMDIAQVTVLRNGQEVAHLRPRIDRYPQMSMTIAGAHSTLEGDFYVLLTGWEEINHETATFKVYLNPLVNLVWWGGLVLIVGTLVAAWKSEPLGAAARVKAKNHPAPATA
jgi:cytochrome c-type biogenesis protein CcmF